jgi:hypothetical protein
MGALSRVEARENKSLARDQRRIRAAELGEAAKLDPKERAFRENAADISQPADKDHGQKQDQKKGQRKRRPRDFG